MKLIILVLLTAWPWAQYLGVMTAAKPRPQDNSGKKEGGRILKAGFGFPVWLERDIPPYGGGTTHYLYAYMAPEYFHSSTIETVLTGLAKERGATPDLMITLFSDELMLRRTITQGFLADSYDTFIGRKDRKEAYLPRTGYYRAYYFRKPDGREWIEYTPDPNKEKRISID
jgi:hypothetical protein